MKITAITKFKHGELYAMLQRVGWTQADLARHSNLAPSRIGEIINLKRRPIQKEAEAIQMALGTVGQYLDVLSEWPETFIGLRRGYRREQTIDVPMERLLDHPEVFQIAAPEDYVDEGIDLEKRVESVISKIPKRYLMVLRKRFWENKTLKQVGKELKVTRGRIATIESAALRLLRHPAKKRKLRPEMFEPLNLPNETQEL